MRKGVILAGGKGTRLLPLTKTTNKHLLPVYDEPMIMHPLRTLMSMGVEDILIVSGGEHLGGFIDLLGDGSDMGINLSYKVQSEAKGIAHALLLAEDFVKNMTDDNFAVILGDNIFERHVRAPSKCGIVLKEVDDAKRFGVYTDGKIVEKPENPESRFAVTGLYFYTQDVFDFIRTLEPSQRGELEITDVNNWCLENLPTEIIHYDGFWSDAGTHESLLRASNFISEHKKS